MRCYGLNQGWQQIGVGTFFTHDIWPAPSAPIEKFMPGMFEGPAPMGWIGGRYVSHKVGTTTYFDGNPAVQQGHDAGYFVLHSPQTLLMWPIHTSFSKHKVMFPITSVLIDKKPMGVYLCHFFGLICSNPVSLPTGVLIKLSGTVMSDMTLADLILGFVFILVDVAIDAVWSLIVKGDKWNVTPGKYKLLFGQGFKVSAYAAGKVPWFKRVVLNKIFNENMTKGPASLFFRQWGSKLADHVAKSFGASPLSAGAIFQLAQLVHPFVGSRREIPGIAVGRAQFGWGIFPWGGRGNLFN
jgi:hypothetical protein